MWLLLWSTWANFAVSSTYGKMSTRFSAKRNIIYIAYLLAVFQRETSADCKPLQYADLGSKWTAGCSFPFKFDSVYWYDSLAADIDPVIRYERGETGDFIASGVGYTSGFYDIQSNGLLVIPNVTIENERSYKALVLDNQHSVFEYETELKISVPPKQAFPHVPGCEENTCLFTYQPGLVLQCSLNHVRPPANLSWYLKRGDADERIQAPQITFPDGSFTYTSSISINITSLKMQPVMELFCRVSGIESMSSLVDTLILIDNSVNPWDEQNPSQIIQTPVSMNNPTVLSCTYETKPITFIWKRIEHHESIVLAFSGQSEGRVHITSNQRIEVSKEGLLSFDRCDVTCEGQYMCIYNDGETFDRTIYQTIVLIGPSPPYLIVDGCSRGLLKCKIHLKSLDYLKNLTCSVQSVYPELSLAFESDFPLEITVSKQRHIVTRTRFTFDVTVYGELRVLETFSCNTLHTVTCTATGPSSSSFIPYKTIEVSYDTCRHSQVPSTVEGGPNYTTVFTVLGVVIIVILAAAAAVSVMFKLHLDSQTLRHLREQNQVIRNKSEKITELDDACEQSTMMDCNGDEPSSQTLDKDYFYPRYPFS